MGIAVKKLCVATWIIIGLVSGIGTVAEAGVTLKADIGLAGTFVAGSWTPVRVLAENMPDPKDPEERLKDVTGELRVTVLDKDGQAVRFTQLLELPAQSRKLVELPIMLPETNLPVRIEFADAKGRTIVRMESSFASNSGANQRYQAGVVPTVLIEQDPNRSLEYPAWGAQATNVQRVSLEALPSDFKSYAQVKVLLIRSRLSSALSPEQLAALHAWLEFGGKLIVVASHAPSELKLDEWLTDHMPAIPDVGREVRLEELARESGPETVLFVEWKDRHANAETILDSPLGPVALRRQIGLGSVIAVAVDPAGMSKDMLEKTPFGHSIQRVFDSVLMAPTVEDLRARHNWSTADVNPDFEVDLLPNRSVITLVIVAFVLIVGPLNFNYLRRIRRLELAWVTIPGFSILFFIAVYGFGVLTKGNQQFWASAELLHLRAGESRGLLLFSAQQFSPTTRRYYMTPPSGGTILPLTKFYDPPNYDMLAGLNLGSGTGNPDYPAIAMKTDQGGYDLISPGEQWAAHFYQGERLMEINGSIDGSVTLLPDNQALIEITNNTQSPLLSSTIYLGGQLVIVGDISPGEKWSSQQEVRAAKFLRPQDHDDTNYLTPEAERQQMAYLDEALSGEYADAPRPSSPFVNNFEKSTFDKVSSGSYASYPIQALLHPQRRARLIARQSLWQSDIKIVPPPDESKIAGLVEVALPIKVAGKVRMESGVGGVDNKVNRLRADVIDWDRTNTSFYAAEGEVCTLGESFVEMVVSPPELTGPAEFESGTLDLRFTGPAKYLLVRVFNFKTGKWDIAYQDITTENQLEKSYPGPSPNILKDWVNPLGNYVRLRIDSREPPKTAAQKAGNINMPFSSPGIQVVSVGASMTFQGSDPPVSTAATSTDSEATSTEKGANP